MEPLSLRGSLLRLQSDERLAALAARGHQAAFEALVRRYRPPLVRACQRILHDGLAEDAAQQALLSAYQALRRHGPPDLFRPWLFRIAINAAVKMAPQAAAGGEFPAHLAGGEQPEEARELHERVRGTVRAVAALPARQRRALVARELEGRSHEEIALELGLTGGAVRQLIHRARTSVRAAASALLPYGALVRLLERAGPEASGRLAEIAAPAAGAGVGAKVALAAVLAGGVAGGAALAPVGEESRPQPASAQQRPAPLPPAPPDRSPGATLRDSSGPGSGAGGTGSSSGPGGGNTSSSGPSPSSGPSASSGSGSDSSGSGFSGSGSSSGSSDSGSSGPGSSGSTVSDSSSSGPSSDSDLFDSSGSSGPG